MCFGHFWNIYKCSNRPCICWTSLEFPHWSYGSLFVANQQPTVTFWVSLVVCSILWSFLVDFPFLGFPRTQVIYRASDPETTNRFNAFRYKNWRRLRGLKSFLTWGVLEACDPCWEIFKWLPCSSRKLRFRNRKHLEVVWNWHMWREVNDMNLCMIISNSYIQFNSKGKCCMLVCLQEWGADWHKPYNVQSL